MNRSHHAVLASRSLFVVCGMACTAFVHAKEPETAASILGKVRAAVGYNNIAAHTQGLHATGAAKVVGLDATYSLIFTGDRAAIQRLDGPISTVGAIEGDTVWSTDIGGETRVASGSDRETTEMGLLMLSYGYLAPKSPLNFTLDPAATNAAETTLTFAREDAIITGTLVIDNATNLPKTWTYKAGLSNSTANLSNYIAFDGIKMPASIQTASTSGAHVDITIDKLADAPTFVRSPYQMIDAPPADIAFDAAVSPEIEVVKAPTGHLLVHPTVNGKDVGWFIFDTGAGSMVLSTPAATELAIEGFGNVPATGVGGVKMSTFHRPDTLTLGPVTMSKPLMVGIDLSFLEQYMGRKIGGLIGYNLLARTTCKIDVETPAISIHDPATFKDPTAKWQKLFIEQRVPNVEAAFEDHKGLFRLDTGAAQMTVSMHQPAVEQLKLLENRETQDAMAGGVGGMVKTKKGNLAWFKLGGKRTENLPAEFALEPKGAFADPYTLGNIGGQLLKPFILITDYRNNRIAFIERK